MDHSGFRYGLEGGSLRAGGQRGSVWWRELVRIREGVGEPGGSWFMEHVSRRVGDGSDTLFWIDPWLDGISLRERFGRLFELTTTKSRSVVKMFALGWGAYGGRGSGGGICGCGRRRCWGSVSLYFLTFLCRIRLLTGGNGALTLTQVPLKVSIFAWRLLRDRLPTRANLITRGVLSPTVATCVFGCGAAESAHHLFLSCS
ncbi:cysteine-rich receptor-like protein kinase, partial [Trifolium pratense]